METERQLVSSWEAITKNTEGEAEVHELHKYAYRPSYEEWKAEPANIVPSNREAVDRPYKTLFVFGDAQIDYRRVINHETQQEELVPIHDERAMKIARYICRDLHPDVIVNLGDTVDLAALSRFKPDSDHFQRTLGPSFQRVHDFYAELRSDNPEAEIVEVDSNHNTRFKNKLLKDMPEMYNVHRPGETEQYPVMSYPYLVNLGHVGVRWYSGYGAAEYRYKDDLAFIHGTVATASGSTAAKLSQTNPDRNIVQGHAHRAESFHRTTRDGRVLGAYVVGALCRTTGEVPSYHSGVDDNGFPVRYQENWQQSVMAIKDFGEGHYQFDHVLIHDGRAFYDGKEYNGNE